YDRLNDSCSGSLEEAMHEHVEARRCPMEEEQKYWFPAKRYGWGWGLPITWQGWLTLVVFILMTVISIYLIRSHIFAGDILLILSLAVFLWIVAWKGEPPTWRWGGK
ncbi:MAG: hypothetical protein OWQ56_11435, partial [Acidithiobacillus caldus]|nr:hypothetical protein [Acidithiobacillus caldus]